MKGYIHIVTFLYLLSNIFGFLSECLILINLVRNQTFDFSRPGWITVNTFYFLYISLNQSAQWCFAHMYFVRVNEIKFLYLFGTEHAQKRKKIYTLAFWILLGIEVCSLTGVYLYEILSHFSNYSTNCGILQTTIVNLFNVLVFIVAILRVNVMLSRSYPQLEFRLSASFLHVGVGLLVVITTFLYLFVNTNIVA